MVVALKERECGFFKVTYKGVCSFKSAFLEFQGCFYVFMAVSFEVCYSCISFWVDLYTCFFGRNNHYFVDLTTCSRSILFSCPSFL